MDLFSAGEQTDAGGFGRPLAERLRPRTFSEFVGQSRVLGEGTGLRLQIEEKGETPNLILWGPPGTGKTSFSRLLANYVNAEFLEISAIDSGVKVLKKLGDEARFRRLAHQRRTLLFVDEIHRFNKAQQDVLLPYAEKGDFVLVGATTENPGYELNKALLSRCRLVVFDPLSLQDLQIIGIRAFGFLNLDSEDILSSEALQSLAQRADGDARKFIGWIEQLSEIFLIGSKGSRWQFPLKEETIWESCFREVLKYDRSSDMHYDCISAFIKSIRGSDPDAGIYYLARMLAGGEDPIFIARRLIILASEDVGNADPRGLSLAVAGLQAVEAVGLPEAAINLAQVVTYLACAPKSNRSYLALKRAQDYVEKTGSLEIPLALRSAKNFASRELGFGKDYLYSHEGERGWLAQGFLPQHAEKEKFFEPAPRGFEKTMQQYLGWMKKESK